jgi:uncharacterized protein (DUF924 family)
MTAKQIKAMLDFWFDVDPYDAAAMKAKSKKWFASAPAEDRELAAKFGSLAEAAAAGKLDPLAVTAEGQLGLIILLDQFPRNLNRGTAAAFAQDAKALDLCVSGMQHGDIETLPALQRVFFCMPLQHAESREMQALSVKTFEDLATTEAPAPLAAALKGFANYAVMHRDIIECFGRFPHRNKVLGRQSTEAEFEYLNSGGSSFGQ